MSQVNACKYSCLLTFSGSISTTNSRAGILVKYHSLYRVVVRQTQRKEKFGVDISESGLHPGPTPHQTRGQAEGDLTPRIGHRGRAKHLKYGKL